jgi:hypothetical protein
LHRFHFIVLGGQRNSMENLSKSKLSRRTFVQRSLMAGAATSLLPTAGQAETAPVSVPVGPSLFEQIGVRPLINAKGTYTIISGSLSLPEVKQAMEEAGRHYVNMDELMAAVGARLAKITGADWGIVTAGCAAAIAGATAACIAGKVAEDAVPREGWSQESGDHPQALAQSL